MYVDFGCIFSHYFSDTGTTLALGGLPESERARHNALRDTIAAGADAMRPGVKASAVHNAMWQAFTSHGFDNAFPHGHGLGTGGARLSDPGSGQRTAVKG